MHIKWIAGLPEEEAQTMRDLVKRNTILMARLKKLVQDKQDASERNRLKEEDYSLPSWSHKQADINGYQRAIKEILELIG